MDLLYGSAAEIERGTGLTSQLLGLAKNGKYQVGSINLNELLLKTAKAFGRGKRKRKRRRHRLMATDAVAAVGARADSSGAGTTGMKQAGTAARFQLDFNFIEPRIYLSAQKICAFTAGIEVKRIFTRVVHCFLGRKNPSKIRIWSLSVIPTPHSQTSNCVPSAFALALNSTLPSLLIDSGDIFDYLICEPQKQRNLKMCRLLGIYGLVHTWREVVMAFTRQAESCKLPPIAKMSTGHKDGWGMTLSNRKQSAMVSLIRQLGSAFDSPGCRQAVYALPDPPGIFLCHFRKPSDTTPITLSNTHPFIHNGWAFIHNGTVYRAQSLPRDSSLVFTSEDSDTEHLFHYLLTKIQHRPGDKKIISAIKEAVFSITCDYTALNMILSNGKAVYALRCFTRYEDYYTLYYYHLPAGDIQSSEPVESEGLSQDRRTLRVNKCLLKIQGSPPRIEESPM